MVLKSKYLVLSFSAVAAAAAAVVAYMNWRKHRRREYHVVGHVSGLFIYPVKSCRGIPLESTKCLRQGLQHDRRWIILNEKGNMICQRQKPSLALVVPSLKLSDDGEVECLYLDAPNMETLKVELPLTNEEYREIKVFEIAGEGQWAGEAAGAWISKYLDKPGCQLFHMTKPRELRTDLIWGHDVAPNEKRATSHTLDNNWAIPESEPMFVSRNIGFGDFAPVLVATTEALDALNKELESPVTMSRFRPNVIVTGTSTYDEDNWKKIKIRDVEMRYLKHCDRCTMTTVDPERGVKTGREPLHTLRRIRMPADRDKRYANAPFFGLHTTLEKGGEIKVGDAVYAKE